jgi:ABC-2 type transport system ATP-binding protein
MIEFRNVSKRYAKKIGGDAHIALRDVSFRLRKGQTLGVIGANGAGKTTAFRLIMGFMKQDQGSIDVYGTSPYARSIKQKIGYLPELANFPPNLNVMDMLRFAGRTCKMSKKQINTSSERLLKLLDLWNDRKKLLRHYSKGMQQRANFALTLLHDPDLLILDEPMSGLDPFGRESTIDLILRLKREGKTILFSSHILEDVDRLVDDVLVLHRGKGLFQGKVSELCEQRETSLLVNAFLKLVTQENEAEDDRFN